MHNDTKYIDTLRLSDPDRKALLAQLQRDERTGPEMRCNARISYDVAAGLVILIQQLGGNSVHYLVRPRNISRGGIGFLHGQFVHSGCKCEMNIRTLTGSVATVRGEVAWCRHVTGRVHEVGVRFHNPIDLSVFVDNCVRTDQQLDESRPLASLRGRLLYIDPSELQQDLLHFHLSTLGLQVDAAKDAMLAMERFEQHPYDLILTDYGLPGANGSTVIDMIRHAGFTKPLIVLTSDTSEAVRTECLAHGATAVLTRPYTLEQLLEVIAPHLGPARPAAAASTEVCYSTYWSKAPMRPLILKFLGKLEESVHQLISLIHSNADPAATAKLCMEIRGAAGGYGFPKVMAAADTLLRLLTTAKRTPKQLEPALVDLKDACTAACHIPERLKSA